MGEFSPLQNDLAIGMKNILLDIWCMDDDRIRGKFVGKRIFSDRIVYFDK